jgi:hypothetical protein
MKPLFIALILLIAVPVYAEVTITFKNGNTMTWGGYHEQGDDYCTIDGKLCYNKKDIASIKEESYSENVTVFNPKAFQTTSADRLTQEAIDQCKKMIMSHFRTGSDRDYSPFPVSVHFTEGMSTDGYERYGYFSGWFRVEFTTVWISESETTPRAILCRARPENGMWYVEIQ